VRRWSQALGSSLVKLRAPFSAFNFRVYWNSVRFLRGGRSIFLFDLKVNDNFMRTKLLSPALWLAYARPIPPAWTMTADALRKPRVTRCHASFAAVADAVIAAGGLRQKPDREGGCKIVNHRSPAQCHHPAHKGHSRLRERHAEVSTNSVDSCRVPTDASRCRVVRLREVYELNNS